MEKLKLASSSLGERLKTGGAQMSRMVSSKMKEILQAPTPESKMVDEATAENMEEPNWGMNLRICALINSEEFSGTEIVKAIKKKISGKSDVSQRLSLDLLEVCTSNCEKVFSEVASEKVLEEMVRMIDDSRTHPDSRERALQLIKAWGQSEDLNYLPVFHQTYTSLQMRGTPRPREGNMPLLEDSMETYVHQRPLSPPGSYPVPDSSLQSPDHDNFLYSFGSQTIEEKQELLLIARNSLDLFSSLLNSGTEPKLIQDDTMVSMLEKCKRLLPSVQRIVESTTDDEVMLFDALNIHDELQKVILRYEEMEAASESGRELPENPDTTEAGLASAVTTPLELKKADSRKEVGLGLTVTSPYEIKKADSGKEESMDSTRESGKTDSPREGGSELGVNKRSIE